MPHIEFELTSTAEPAGNNKYRLWRFNSGKNGSRFAVQFELAPAPNFKINTKHKHFKINIFSIMELWFLELMVHHMYTESV